MKAFAKTLSAVRRNIKVPGLDRIISAFFPADWKSSRYVIGICKRKDGLLMKLDTRNHIDWQLYFVGEFEPQISQLIKKVLKLGNVAIDVGANIGTHALEMADAAGIATLRVPLEEDATFSNQGLASLTALDTAHRKINVEVTTIDDFVDAQGLSQLDFVKIDTQGYDAKVIRGMSRSLQSYKPIVVFEYEAWAWEKTDESLLNLVNWLGQRSYSVHELRLQHDKIVLKPLLDGCIPDHADMVAIHAKSVWRDL